MRKLSQDRWSLTKSYYSNGNTSAAMTQRFFQTLRQDKTKPLFARTNNVKNQSVKVPIKQSPNHVSIKRNNLRSLSKNNQSIFSQTTDRIPKQTSTHKISLQQNKVFKLKEKFERVLKRKTSLDMQTEVNPTQIKLAISSMGVLPYNHKHFNQLYESVIQMMRVASSCLSATNLFIILLGFHNIQVTEKQLSWIVLNEDDSAQVIKLSKQQIIEMHEMYVKLNDYSSNNQNQNPLIISITLPNKEKQQNIFTGRQSCKQIAGSLMSKYNIPQKKRKNMERIIFSKLHEKKLI